MKTALGIMKSREAQRSAEIVLIMLVLLLVFSVGGVPMILLSTSTPTLVGDDLEGHELDTSEINALDARVVV